MVDRLLASLAAKESQRNAMEERLNDSKPLDDLKERESELQYEKDGLPIILNSENSPPSDKEVAGAESQK